MDWSSGRWCCPFCANSLAVAARLGCSCRLVGPDSSAPSSGESSPEEFEEPPEEAVPAHRSEARGDGKHARRMPPVQHGIRVYPSRRRRRHRLLFLHDETPHEPLRAILPPPKPVAHPSESDDKYEHSSSSDDGVNVQAEERNPDETHHEDLEDKHGIEGCRRGRGRATSTTSIIITALERPTSLARPPVLPTRRWPSIQVLSTSYL